MLTKLYLFTWKHYDTPSKSLFSESNCAFSHGCIRLSDAEKLADYLLKNDTAWIAQKINAAMQLGMEQFVTVNKSETIFIVYFTAWVDAQGQLNFRKDLYERDKPLAAMLDDCAMKNEKNIFSQ